MVFAAVAMLVLALGAALLLVFCGRFTVEPEGAEQNGADEEAGPAESKLDEAR